VEGLKVATVFLISDTHFSHSNIIAYCGRPFGSAEEMDEVMVERWNKVVRPSDHVWHLGDVAMGRPALKVVERLNGQKRLVFGNHDIYDWKSYREVGFEKFHGVRVFADRVPRLICTHYPIHPAGLHAHRGVPPMNVHGHIHQNPTYPGRYVNVSVEVTDYRPVSLEEIPALYERQQNEAARLVPPTVVCPKCGQEVKQVASATLELALWQHQNWACPARENYQDDPYWQSIRRGTQ
jgi:calcineurin-like phosphoesterase family protein